MFSLYRSNIPILFKIRFPTLGLNFYERFVFCFQVAESGILGQGSLLGSSLSLPQSLSFTFCAVGAVALPKCTLFNLPSSTVVPSCLGPRDASCGLALSSRLGLKLGVCLPPFLCSYQALQIDMCLYFSGFSWC